MQQKALLNRKARKALLSSVFVFALFLFFGVSSMVAQNWVPAAEATVKSDQEASTLRAGLAAYQPGTLDYEKQIRKMNLFNHIAENLKIDANVGLAVELAVAATYTVGVSTPVALRPVKGEDAEGRTAAITLLSN